MEPSEVLTKTQQLYPWLMAIERHLHEMNPAVFIHLSYVRETEYTIKRFSTFQQQYHGILPGDEYIYVTDDTKGELFYAINVSGDSVLTCIAELMDLLSRKF